ncbi:Apoptosis-inducing factor homolog A [Linum grandiflorum]
MTGITESQNDSSSGRRLVIVGGGVAGSLLAKSAQFTADVTLIDPKDYYEITWANLRGMVEPAFAERIVIKHRDYFTNGRIVTSHAVNITEKEVLTYDGESVPYDYLVIAAGHKDPLPETRKDRLAQFHAENERIKSASSILIIGGGPTGVELAAEIAVDFPGKEGKPLASSWLKDTVLGDSLDSKGRLMVDEHLKEMKQGYLAQSHATVVAKNLKVMMSSGKQCRLSSYKPGLEMAIVSLGRREAVAQFPFATVGGVLPGYIKSKDMFVGKTRKLMGLHSHVVEHETED